MLRTEKRMRLCTALLAANLVFIWGNSLIPGAFSEVISNAVKGILEFFLPIGEESGSGGFLVRKFAHFTEFAALGALLGWRFAMLGKGKGLPFLLGAAAACVDETIQLFVPDRGPGLRDVCIDAGGVLTGIVLLHLVHALLQSNRKTMEDK